MKTVKKLITPAIAKEMLLLNTFNRDLKKDRIDTYAADMVAGRWFEETPEGIIISKTNRILNGQNRLHAVVKANKGIFFYVTTDVDDEIFAYLDSGAPRSGADCFKVAGIKYHAQLPSIILLHNSLKLGYKNKHSAKMTNAMLLERYQQRKEFWDDVAAKTYVWYKNLSQALPPSVIGGMYAYFHEIHKVDALNFMTKFASGMDVKSPPIISLRLRIINDAGSLTPMKMPYKNALIIKAWNFFRQNKNTKVLKYNAEQEDFPVAI